MTTSGFSEQDIASMEGPRPLKDPGSTPWCWQTVSALQHMWHSLHLNYENYMSIMDEAEEHAIWEKIPPDAPYETKENMLKQVEVGSARDAHKRMRIQTIAAQARASQKHGGNRRGADFQVSHEKLENGGGSQDYIFAVLQRDHPDIFQRVCNGEFASARAAAKEAGLALAQSKKTMTLGDNVDRVADTLKAHYSAEQVERIIERLRDVALEGHDA